MTDSSLPPEEAPLAAALAPSPAAATHTAIMQLMARVVGLLAVVASTSLVTRRLGTEFVDWATVLSAVALVGVLLEPGMSPVVVRRLTLDHELAPKPVALLPVRLLLGLVSFCVVVGICVVTRGVDALPLAIVLGAQVLPRAVVCNATPWLQMDQRLHRQALLEAGTAVVGLTALALGVALGLPTPALGALAFTGPLTLLAILMRRELWITPSRRLPSPGPQWPKVWSVVRQTAPLAVALILAATYTRTSIAFVNAYETNAVASQFFFAFLFAEQSIVVAGIVSGAVLPLLAARATTTELTSDEVTQRLMVAVTATGALVCAALLATAVPLTRIIGGADLVGAERFVRLLAPMAAVVMPAMVLGYVYISVGRGGRYLAFAVVGLAGNLLLNAVFTPANGAFASARITWVTELLVMVLPMTAVVGSGRGGRRTGQVMTALVGVSVVASELTSSGRLAGPLGALLVVVVVVVVAGSPLVWMLQTIGLRHSSAPSH